MNRDIWITSDTHFRHQAMLGFKDRDGNLFRGDLFDNVDHMDQLMIERWNSVVKQGDIVYHLGDVAILKTNKDIDWFKRHWPTLNGSKRLIVGNHDDVKFLSSGGFFKKVSMWRMFPEYQLMLSHVPMHYSNMMRLVDPNGTWPDDCVPLYGVHGHIHSNQSPRGPYRNVCVEVTDYTPIHIETLAAEAKDYMTNQWPGDQSLFQY